MLNLTAALQERLYFLYKFIRFPKQIGSVTPSSPFLAKTMLDAVPWGNVTAIAELGSGTGAITKHLLAASPQPQHVLLFEKDDTLRAHLARQYPDYAVYEDACQLETALLREGIEQLDCILSGLPFFNFPQAVRDQILEQINATLKPGGLFIAFQYSHQMKKQLSDRFDLLSIEFVPVNVPPAFVYVCQKRSEPN
ncbi:UNVERIFIED_CONTAM: phospholipid N-methyltransferase [Brevibacillus sp. OAP136]